MRWFLPEHITQLYYTPIYSELPVDARRDYNRLYAGYCCEMFIHFEEALPPYVKRIVADGLLRPELAQAAQELVASEARHAAMFRALNRELNPEIYAGRDHFFLQFPALAMWGLRRILSAPRLFPAVLWIVMLQEERAVYYSREVLRLAETLDPRVVDVYRRHLEDEAAHLDVDAELLAAVWDGNRPWIRQANAWLFRLAVRELLTTPRRAGRRLVEYWIGRHPEISGRRDEILRQFGAVGENVRFQEAFYSRQIVPKTFASLDRYEEFRTLGDVLWGYSRSTL